jgi:hypothetical protein
MHLIGIHGKARCGKDTCAAYLVKYHGFIRQAFADPLKRAAQHIFGLTDEQTWEDGYKEVVIDYWGMSPRQMFQKLGTEAGRNVFGQGLWIRRWAKFYSEFGDVANIVVPDVRFDNEADLIRGLGGKVILLTSSRGNNLDDSAKAHASEAGIVVKPGDIPLANNSSYQSLYAKIDQVIDCLGHPGAAP